MNIIGIVKPAATLVASIGVGAVIGNVIKATTPTSVTLVQKVAVGVGSFVLVNVLGDMAARALDASIDRVADGVHEIRNAVKDIPTEDAK